MQRPLSDYSGDERRQIAALARRNLRSEISLILSGGFSLMMVILFVFAEWTFLPVALATGMRAIVVWIGMSFLGAAIWAVLHDKRMRPRIAAAQTLNAAFLSEYQLQVQLENRQKARKLR